MKYCLQPIKVLLTLALVRVSIASTQIALSEKFVHPDVAPGDQFSYRGSVSVSSDAKYFAVGAPSDDVVYTAQGSVYVFLRSESSWIQQAKLVGSDGQASDSFGHPTAISSDGTFLAIGAPQDDGTYTDEGSVYIFARSGSIWSQSMKLTAANAQASAAYGYSLSMSRDAAYLVVGAYGEDLTYSDQGAVYIYVRADLTGLQSPHRFVYRCILCPRNSTKR